ncbi:MAG TPA: hypothetical protein VEK84_02725 [Terriglobales bacterium]|nr:hypothetical protein [Terriglobales bacterium]
MKRIQEHQAKHPLLTTALFIVMFAPAILLVILIGRWLRRLAPDPQFWQIILATPLLMLALVGGMVFGAVVFLLVTKHFVEKKVLEPFYIYPGVAVASGLSALLFRWAYRHEGDSSDKERRP